METTESKLSLEIPLRPRAVRHQLRGWQLYLYEVSWPSAVFSLCLVIFAHYFVEPEYENW